MTDLALDLSAFADWPAGGAEAVASPEVPLALLDARDDVLDLPALIDCPRDDGVSVASLAPPADGFALPAEPIVPCPAVVAPEPDSAVLAELLDPCVDPLRADTAFASCDALGAESHPLPSPVPAGAAFDPLCAASALPGDLMAVPALAPVLERAHPAGTDPGALPADPTELALDPHALAALLDAAEPDPVCDLRPVAWPVPPRRVAGAACSSPEPPEVWVDTAPAEPPGARVPLGGRVPLGSRVASQRAVSDRAGDPVPDPLTSSFPWAVDSASPARPEPPSLWALLSEPPIARAILDDALGAFEAGFAIAPRCAGDRDCPLAVAAPDVLHALCLEADVEWDVDGTWRRALGRAERVGLGTVEALLGHLVGGLVGARARALGDPSCGEHVAPYSRLVASGSGMSVDWLLAVVAGVARSLGDAGAPARGAVLLCKLWPLVLGESRTVCEQRALRALARVLAEAPPGALRPVLEMRALRAQALVVADAGSGVLDPLVWLCALDAGASPDACLDRVGEARRYVAACMAGVAAAKRTGIRLDPGVSSGEAFRAILDPAVARVRSLLEACGDRLVDDAGVDRRVPADALRDATEGALAELLDCAARVRAGRCSIAFARGRPGVRSRGPLGVADAAFAAVCRAAAAGTVAVVDRGLECEVPLPRRALAEVWAALAVVFARELAPFEPPVRAPKQRLDAQVVVAAQWAQLAAGAGRDLRRFVARLVATASVPRYAAMLVVVAATAAVRAGGASRALGAVVAETVWPAWLRDAPEPPWVDVDRFDLDVHELVVALIEEIRSPLAPECAMRARAMLEGLVDASVTVLPNTPFSSRDSLCHSVVMHLRFALDALPPFDIASEARVRARWRGWLGVHASSLALVLRELGQLRRHGPLAPIASDCCRASVLCAVDLLLEDGAPWAVDGAAFARVLADVDRALLGLRRVLGVDTTIALALRCRTRRLSLVPASPALDRG